MLCARRLAKVMLCMLWGAASSAQHMACAESSLPRRALSAMLSFAPGSQRTSSALSASCSILHGAADRPCLSCLRLFMIHGRRRG